MTPAAGQSLLISHEISWFYNGMEEHQDHDTTHAGGAVTILYQSCRSERGNAMDIKKGRMLLRPFPAELFD